MNINKISIELKNSCDVLLKEYIATNEQIIYLEVIGSHYDIEQFKADYNSDNGIDIYIEDDYKYFLKNEKQFERIKQKRLSNNYELLILEHKELMSNSYLIAHNKKESYERLKSWMKTCPFPYINTANDNRFYKKLYQLMLKKGLVQKLHSFKYRAYQIFLYVNNELNEEISNVLITCMKLFNPNINIQKNQFDNSSNIQSTKTYTKLTQLTDYPNTYEDQVIACYQQQNNIYYILTVDDDRTCYGLFINSVNNESYWTELHEDELKNYELLFTSNDKEIYIDEEDNIINKKSKD